MGSGGRYAMISGVSTMQMWCVVSLDSRAHPLLLAVHRTVRDQAIFGWTMSSVKEEGVRYLIVLTSKYGQMLIVAIRKMQVWFVTLRWLQTTPEAFVFCI